MAQDKVLDLAHKLSMHKRFCEALGRDNYPVTLTKEEIAMISDILVIYHQEVANGCL